MAQLCKVLASALISVKSSYCTPGSAAECLCIIILTYHSQTKTLTIFKLTAWANGPHGPHRPTSSRSWFFSLFAGNPMGIAMANLISPYAVRDPQHLPMLVCTCICMHFRMSFLFVYILDEVRLYMLCPTCCIQSLSSLLHVNYQMWIYAIPAGASFLLTIVSFWHDQPAIPPAPTASTQNTSLRDFLRGVWNVSIISMYSAT